MNLIHRFITDPKEIPQLIKDGWTVTGMDNHHGHHAAQATIPEDTWKRLGDVAENVVSDLKAK